MDDVKAVLLDIDGTLLLSNEAHAQAFVDAAAAIGVDSNPDVIRRLIGKGGDKLIPEAFGFSSESALGKKLDEQKAKIFKSRYLPALQPAPGSRELLTRFKIEGMTLVVATSAGKEDVHSLLDRAGIKDLIDDETSADDVQASKPDPDIVQAAIRKSGTNARNTVMLGDTPYDVEAATRAGIRIIAVRCGGWPDKDLHGAIAIYDHPADLLAHFNQAFHS